MNDHSAARDAATTVANPFQVDVVLVATFTRIGTSIAQARYRGIVQVNVAEVVTYTHTASASYDSRNPRGQSQAIDAAVQDMVMANAILAVDGWSMQGIPERVFEAAAA